MSMPRSKRAQRYRRPLGALAALGLIGTVTLASAATPSADTGHSREMFGISMGGEAQYESATRERDLDAIRAAGARWVRIDLTWSVIQRHGPSSYDWTELDKIVRGITSRGMRVLGTLAYTPAWARPPGTTDKHAPDPDRFAAFASRAASHFGAMGVHHYELWNEPNIGFWAPEPDPVAYTRLLRAAYPAIKDADPTATVMTGGLSPASSNDSDYSPVDFLKQIYANGGGGSFDAVAHHPYCWPAYPGDDEPWSAWTQMAGTAESLRSVMAANGDGDKRIWGTEYGAPTNGPRNDRVSQGEQADMITEAYVLWSEFERAGPLFIHQGRDIGTRKHTRDNFFGLLRHDFSAKPGYGAYQNLVTTLHDGTDPGQLFVKGKSKRRRAVKVTGALLGVTGANESATPASEVKLRLFRRTRHIWRSASRARKASLRPGGLYRKRLRSGRTSRLRRGTYRVRALYLGSVTSRPAVARSGKFRVRR